MYRLKTTDPGNMLLTYSIISLQYTHVLHSGHSVPPQSDSHSKEKLKITVGKTFPSLSPLWLFFGYLATLFQVHRLYSVMTHFEFEMYPVLFYLYGLKINLLRDNVNTIKSNSCILITDQQTWSRINVDKRKYTKRTQNRNLHHS